MLLADFVRKLVAANRIEEALAVLKQQAGPADDSLRRQVVLHSGNFTRIREDKEKGKLSKADEQLFFSRISNALLDIAEALPEGLAIEVSRQEKARLNARLFLMRWGAWLLLVFWSALFGLGVALQAQYQQPVKAVLDVQANRAGFITTGKNRIEAGQAFRSVELGNFGQVEAPAIQAGIREDYSSTPERYPLSEGLLSLSPIPGNESSLFFDNIMLEALTIPRRTQLTLTVPGEEAPEEYYLSLDFKPGDIRGALSYQDSVFFEGAYLSLSGLEGGSKDLALALISAYAPGGRAYEISFTGNPAHSYLTLEPKAGDSISIQEQSITVDSLSFIRPIDGISATSSILEGSIHFLSKRNRSFRKTQLGNQDYLRLLDYDYLEITSLRLGREHIRLKLAGTIGKIYSGPNLDGLALQNPGRLEWLWYNRPGWIFGILGGGILATLGISLYTRKARRL